MRFQAVYEVKHYTDLQKVKQCNFSIFLLKYNYFPKTMLLMLTCGIISKQIKSTLKISVILFSNI